MISPSIARRAQALTDEGVAFVTATVVRAQRPTSVKAGSVALVLADGAIEGFAGGACTEASLRATALQAMASGETVLLRIVPFDDHEPVAMHVTAEDGIVVAQNPCLSGGTLEIFLEPVLPAPRVLVVGDSPIAGALARIGPEIGLTVVGVEGDAVEPRPHDLAVIAAAHGRDELHTLRRGLEAGIPYIGLVASRQRATGVLAELRGDGVAEDLLARIDVPAGLWIGAQTPAEIALSILAQVVAVRRGVDVPAVGDTTTALVLPVVTRPAPELAIDPICGMTVAASPSTPSVTEGDTTTWFCCEGCKRTYESRRDRADVTD